MDEEDEERDEELEEPPAPAGDRVIVHLDLDCFYAQVETLRNPALKGKPLGVRQKSLVVTCNYEARKFGVGKLMPVRAAKAKCPQLVLVKGEDLTPYREMSSKVTELLEEFCPLVERLGLDENFVDITELVGKRLRHLDPRGNSQIRVCGHVYDQQGINWQDPRHLQLLLGSQVAQEFRDSLKSRLGLTGCAGVAPSKLLAKLVSGTFKPDQQTVLLPEKIGKLLSGLENLRKVPGIGHRTAQRLESLGIRHLRDLRDYPTNLLEKEFGFSAARNLRNLGLGQDNSQVTPSGPPQSFSDEDSFPRCSSAAEAAGKLRELLPNLLSRISKDGRRPRTVRLTIRRFDSRENGSRRESRQCPLPSHLVPKFGEENPALIPPLLDLLLQLLGKMLPLEFPFHLTLLSVCFSNLQEIPGGKRSLDFYLRRERSQAPGREAGPSSSDPKSRRIPEKTSGRAPAIPEFPGLVFPPGIDPEVFRELPLELKQELTAEWNKREENSQDFLEKSPKKGRNSAEKSPKKGQNSPEKSPKKAQNSTEKSPKKGQNSRGKRKKNSGSNSQSNNLWNYWKPQSLRENQETTNSRQKNQEKEPFSPPKPGRKRRENPVFREFQGLEPRGFA